MADFSRVEISHLPPNTSVYVGLYRNIENAKFLREQLLNRNSDFEFAFIDARNVRDSFIRCPNVHKKSINS
jgi:EKC/KEOPS complex subunit CGI121/TPRKB